MLSQLLLNILLSASLYLMIAYSFLLIYTTTKIFHLAHGAIISLGAYFVLFFSKELYFNFSVSIVFSVILSSLIGVLFEILFFRQMRKRNVAPLISLITSLGLYIIILNLISVSFGNDVRVINTDRVRIGHQILGGYISSVQIVTILSSITLFVVLSIFIKYNKTGKSIRAIASNIELSNIYGISSNKVILIAFGIGSAIAAVVGILSAMDTNMTPSFGFNILLYGIVVMIIGGVSNVWGLIGGAFLLSAAQNIGNYYIGGEWMNAIAYVILILFLIWKPLGFSGKRLKKIEI